MKKSIVLASIAGLAWAASANAQLSIGPSSVPFTDISVSGTSVGAASDDSEHVLTGATLLAAGWNGNALIPSGMAVRVGNNGGVIVGNSGGDTFTNATDVGYINSTNFMGMTPANTANFGNGGSGPRAFIAPLWDDNTPGAGGGMRWQVIGGDLYIQWTNEDHFNATGTGTVTYQMVARASGASLLDFVYQDTMYGAQAYQNDGGSATIGFKAWGLGGLNDVQYGAGGGTDSLADPAFGGTNMFPKIAGWASANDPTLPHSLSIIPAPGAVALLGLGGLLAGRRRR